MNWVEREYIHCFSFQKRLLLTTTCNPPFSPEVEDVAPAEPSESDLPSQRVPRDEQIQPSRSWTMPTRCSSHPTAHVKGILNQSLHYRDRTFLANDLEALMKNLEEFQEHLNDDAGIPLTPQDLVRTDAASRAPLRRVYPLRSTGVNFCCRSHFSLDSAEAKAASDNDQEEKSNNSLPLVKETSVGKENTISKKEKMTAWERDQMKVPSRVWF